MVQIVGGSLNEAHDDRVITNFETDQDPAAFAARYRADGLPGGHVISLGSGNAEAALSALRAFPGGMQIGGGITPDNASIFLEAGASHVIVTSYVFREGQVDLERLDALVAIVGKDRLVLDLSCRRRGDAFWVVTDRWQRFTEVAVSSQTLEWLAGFCDEFLVHGVDVEGKRAGIDTQLVQMLGALSPLSVTYAGGAKSLADLEEVKALGHGRVDLSIGSALDLFGGNIAYQDVVAWQREQEIML